MLSSKKNFEVVATATNGQQVVDLVQAHRPNLVVMDIAMLTTNGSNAIHAIKHRHPNIVVVALTFHKQPNDIQAALEAGADAYVSKEDSYDDLLDTIDSALKGTTIHSPSIVSVLGTD